MKTTPQCAPCLLNRVLYEAELSTDDKELRFSRGRAGLPPRAFPARLMIKISTGIHRTAYDFRRQDPYRAARS
jgi:uncharacterized protein with ATP-grasp and redox domains